MNTSSSTPVPNGGAVPGADQPPKLNFCQQVLVGILVVLQLSGVVFSVVTLANCSFFNFVQIYGNEPLSTLIPVETDAIVTTLTVNGTTTVVPLNVTEAGFGLLQWSPNFLGCTDYVDRSGLGTAFNTAQVGGLMATSFGIVAVLFNASELLCCRFVCAKVLCCICLMCSVIGQGLTFVIYASDICLHEGNLVYACEFGNGGAWSLMAFLCFLLSTLLVCPTPKPNPLCKQVCDKRQQRKHAVADPCCYCFRKNDKNKEDEDKLDEDKKKEEDAQQDNAEQGANNNNNNKSTHEDSIYNDTITEMPGGGMTTNQPPPPPPNYPQEVYLQQQQQVSQAAMYSSALSVQSVPLSNQYHYYAPKTSFANAEVMDGDLFFDSKTVA